MPDKLTIRGRSADFRDTLNVKREQSYHQKSLGDIVRTLAERNKLKAVIDEKLDKIKVAHIDQTNESMVHFNASGEIRGGNRRG